MVRSLRSGNSERRQPASDDGAHGSVEKIDVTHYLDDMERQSQREIDIARRNQAVAILRRWQFDTMLTDDSCARAARLLRQFTTLPPLRKGPP